jgi:dTDP-4-dehydrorhamnose reductase
MLLLTGSTGMLGRAIAREAFKRGIDVYGVARSEGLDITNFPALEEIFKNVMPSLAINAAANTDIADCEADPIGAHRINAAAPGYMAELSQKYGAYFIQISTDHYYLGDGREKHREDAPVKLVNEYARSKYAGETASLAGGGTVVRTNIVGFRGSTRPAFADWALEAITGCKEVKVFTDYYISSIDVYSFSSILLDFALLKPEGVYNIASCEVFSKYEFFMRFAEKLGVRPVAEAGRLALLGAVQRADSLGLDASRVERLLNRRMPTLDTVVSRLAANYTAKLV